MSTEEHLKMFHCLVDTGADVLRNLAEVRLLDNKKKTFSQFLEDEKHYFFHQFEHKILCCECPPHGCTVSRGKMEAHVFKKVYEFKKENINKSHIVKNGMTNQKCLHAIHTRNVILDELDLSDLNYFLWTKGKLLPQETTAIKIIMDTRNIICHPSSTTSIEFHEINNMWTKLENAILDLSQPERYKNMVKMCIESHRARQETETEKILHGMNQIKETVKDELTKTRTDLTDESKEQTRMLRQLIGRFENLSVVAMASPQVGTDAFQASGGSDQINMTTTIELSSLSNEEQKQIVEKFSSELKVGSEDKNILIDGKQVNSIVLDLRVSSSIFKDTEALRSALMALVWEVVDKGKIDTTIQDTVYVTLTFNSPLSSQESGVLSGVLTPKMLEIADGESEGRIHDSTFGNSTFTPHATQELYWGDLGSKPGASKDDKQGETYSCKSCQQKDIQISELKKNNGKLEENIWILHRFLDSNDQNIDKHHEVLSTICREEIQTTVTQKRSNARLHGEDQSRVIDSKLTESEQRVCQTVIPSQGRLKDKLKADLMEKNKILKDEVMDMKTELKELKTSLIGYIDKQKVDLVMNTDQIEKSIESPENRKVHITATVNQTHVTADTENEIIENLPPEIKIQAINDTLSEAHFLKSMGVSDKRDF